MPIYNLNTYQETTRETAIYPGAGGQAIDALTYLALGLGEAGEIQGKVKKILRDSGGEITTQHQEMILLELGDLLWYVARLADELDSSLAEVAYTNIQKLANRKARGVLGGSGDDR